MFRKAAVAAGLSLAFASAQVQAKGFEALLQGDYAFTGEASCLISPDGFNSNHTPIEKLPGTKTPARFPRISSLSVTGVRTFNGDGTGTLKARVVSISHPFVLPSLAIYERGGVHSLDIWSSFTYTVTADLKVLITTPEVNGKILTGENAGGTTRFTIPPFEGFVSQDHRSVTLAHEEPGIEAHEFFKANGDLAGTDSRICHRSRVLLERKGGK